MTWRWPAAVSASASDGRAFWTKAASTSTPGARPPARPASARPARWAGGERLPVHGRARVRGVEMGGHDREVLGDAPVGDRDPGAGRDGHRAGDPRHDLERDPGPDAGQRLLAAAAEDERVAALEPYHP